MRNTFMSMMIVGVCRFMSLACGGLPNTEGVAFTSGETINLDKFASLGIENVNYMRDTQAADDGVRYRSHYDSRVMAFIGVYGESFGGGERLKCMGIVLPDSVYATERNSFHFAEAMKTELTWLVAKGVIDVASATIERIGISLGARYNSGVNGDLQYWTHADSTLWGYNCWYPYDSIAHKWTNEYSCVKSMGKTQCAVVSPDSGLPPKPLLGATGVASNSIAQAQIATPCIVRYLGNGGLAVFLPQSFSSGARVVVIDCKGARVCVKSVPANARSLCVSGLAFGRYTARLLQK